MHVFAKPQRLMLMCRLSDGECAVGELAAFAGLSQSAWSQHRARLLDAGVITPRRDAQTICYRLEDPAAVRLITLLCDARSPRLLRPERKAACSTPVSDQPETGGPSA